MMRSPRHPRRAAVLACLLIYLLPAACNLAPRARQHPSLDPSARVPTQGADCQDQSFATIFTLAAPMYLYFVEHECWPTDIHQVMQTAVQFDIPLDVSVYSILEMEELQDGRLRVRFETSSPNREQGEFTLSRPNLDDDLSPNRQGGAVA